MRRLALAAFVALVAVLTSAPSAHAACTVLRCSEVYNDRASVANILVAAQWQTTTYNSSTKATVRPGQSSTAFLRDVNAFWVPTGCHGTSKSGTFYGGRWYKPLAGTPYIIRVYCP